MPRSFRFGIENARCFKITGMMPITPITFLVGENSSGKTSYFALLYEVISSFFNMYAFDEDISFDMGSFDDLIHKSEGHQSKREFTLGLDVQYAPPEADLGFIGQDFDGLARISLTYGEHRGQRIVIKTTFSAGNLIVNLRRTEKSIITTTVLPTGICEIRSTPKDRRLYGSSPTIDNIWASRRIIDSVRHALRGQSRIDTAYTTALNRSSKANEALLSRYLMAGVRLIDFINSSFSWPVQATAPIRSEPQRVYLIGSGGPSPQDRVPLALNSLKLYEPERWNVVRKRLSAFGRSTGLFHDIDIQTLRGRKRDAPFELMVKHGSIQSNICDVGYGISQVIPFVVDLIMLDSSSDAADRRAGLHYIQQPEIHLHPAAQAALGSFLYQFARETKTYFIIETHSDFVIDRIRNHIKSEKSGADICSLLFFEQSADESLVHPIRFDRLGNVLDAPPSYRKFFLDEEMRNFGV